VRALLVVIFGCACSGGNGRTGQFYGVWDLEHATSVSSCNGTTTLSGTMAIDPGETTDLEILLRDWPPCGSGIGADVNDDTASGTLICSATVAGSDGSDMVTVDIQSMSLTIDSTNQYLTLSGMQTQTDQAGTVCDLTLAGSAFKPGVISN
jgi:hypothetical protein